MFGYSHVLRIACGSEQVTIQQNLAATRGGGIYVGSHGAVCAFGCDFVLNNANQDGCAIYSDTDAFGVNLTYGSLDGVEFTMANVHFSTTLARRTVPSTHRHRIGLPKMSR
jgi:predicted outer membrane repeat protein